MTGFVDVSGRMPSFPEAQIELCDTAGKVLGTSITNADGEWSIKGVELPVGHHHLTATAKATNGLTNHAGAVDITVYEPVECEFFCEDERYAELVAQWVAGEFTGADAALEILRDAGVSIAEFAADIDAAANASEVTQ